MVASLCVPSISDFFFRQGLYLGREKVAIKVIRAVISDPRSLQASISIVSLWSMADGCRRVSGSNENVMFGQISGRSTVVDIYCPSTGSVKAMDLIREHSAT
jgi:hypothetical protein